MTTRSDLQRIRLSVWRTATRDEIVATRVREAVCTIKSAALYGQSWVILGVFREPTHLYGPITPDIAGDVVAGLTAEFPDVSIAYCMEPARDRQYIEVRWD